MAYWAPQDECYSIIFKRRCTSQNETWMKIFQMDKEHYCLEKKKHVNLVLG